MTDARTVCSQVEVGVDADTAFVAFTDELDLWWVRGPINFFGDAGRVVEMRCEPGVGGRVLEVYDDDASGALELARITAWEPGVRLAWASSVDDVTTEIRFERIAGGTRVVVEAHVPPGGTDRGGTAWTRVVPRWFGRWCDRRDHARHEQHDIARLALAVHYARPAAAARWLHEVFGFEPVSDIPSGPDPLPAGEHGHPWIEFHVGNSSVMLFPRDTAAVATAAASEPSHVPWVYVDDVESHRAHAEKHGATVVRRGDWPWLMFYVADDLEGNRWTIAQARPTMR